MHVNVLFKYKYRIKTNCHRQNIIMPLIKEDCQKIN